MAVCCDVNEYPEDGSATNGTASASHNVKSPTGADHMSRLVPRILLVLWDAQKDMLMDTLGAVASVLLYLVLRDRPGTSGSQGRAFG